MRRLIDSKVLCPNKSNLISLKLVPIEVLCFIWRAKLGRILVAKVLAVRGRHIPSVLWRQNPHLKISIRSQVRTTTHIESFANYWKKIILRSEEEHPRP
ncbi:hypothetical protein L2E82_28513 [Cichorium intybus]|uniref:Uncharacterized protein n=1 Tax=Cichorium intybus TaxID=13427 RepID=A0ACB9CW09_CICIN|nr:hypothetical protein L2E82_28513 [Cichorium intybus]